MKREKIDQALLRKGRLIAEHKFQKLNVDETNKLLTHLGKDTQVDYGMVLADIYHVDVELYKTANKGNIGFNKQNMKITKDNFEEFTKKHVKQVKYDMYIFT